MILFVQRRSVVIFEWEVPSDEREQDHPATPNVCFQSVVAFPCDHFWSGVAWRPTSCLHRIAFIQKVAGEAEVYYFDIRASIQKEILRFHVSVHDVESVDVVHPRNDLLEQVSSFVLLNF